MALSAKEQQTVARAGKHGIKNAQAAFEAWKKRRTPGFDFALACAFLMQETAGGANVFGHDPTIFVGAGAVTKQKYLAYRKLRDATRKYQGVGPMQLTYGGFQDQADKLGGCWTPQANMAVGFGIVRDHVRSYGLFAGVAAYNGSGPAARAYARSVLSIRQSFAHFLAVDKPNAETLAALQPYKPTDDDLAAMLRADDSRPNVTPH